MRFSKEVRVRLNGDRVAAERYRKRALTLLGQVIRQDVELGGLEQSTRRVVMPDGTIITVHANSWMPSVEITVPQEGQRVLPPVSEVVLEFYDFPQNFANTTLYPVLFNQDITAFQSFSEPFGETQPAQVFPAGTLTGDRELDNLGYYSGGELLYVRQVAPDGLGFGVPIFHDVELPGGETRRYEHERVASSPSRGVAYRRGEIVRMVTANQEHTFALVEICQDTGSAVQLSLYLDALLPDGTLEYSVQLGQAFLRATAQAHVYNDRISAWADGFYALLKPTPAQVGYDILKWSSDTGLVWSAAAFPPDVTTPTDIMATQLGPYLVDKTSADQWRFSLLSPANGTAGAQHVIEDFDADAGGFTEMRFAASDNWVYASLNRSDGTGQFFSDQVVDVYSLDFARLRRAEMPEIAERVEAPFDNGFIVPRTDARLVQAA